MKNNSVTQTFPITRTQELVYELKAAGKRMNIVAFLAFALLAASIALNVVLYLQIHRLLP